MFKGMYYKHQSGGKTLCAIAGKANSGNFLQIITNEKVYHFDDYSECSFSENGIILNLTDIKGEIRYSNLTPLKSDIMGFYRFFPMQCRHSVVSMRHDLTGGIYIDGEFINFSGGIGYIEGDSGRSFPKKYLWTHCNDFSEKCSVMASVAHIPFCGFHFQGCVCAIVYNGKEYRLATYNGVKIEQMSQNRLVLTQKRLRLEIDIEGRQFFPLKMPVKSQMAAIVKESNSTKARFRFLEDNRTLFDFVSENVSFEYNY